MKWHSDRAMVSLINLLMVAPLLSVKAVRGVVDQQRESNLLQTWGEALDGTGIVANAAVGSGIQAVATPVARVVNLLKEMAATLTKEMKEDEDQHEKMGCWCKSSEYSKKGEIDSAEAAITDLTSSIEALTAKSSELDGIIKQLNSEIATGQQAISSTKEMREKEAKEASASDKESMQMIETLQAAIDVLSRHRSSALPQLSMAFLQGTAGSKATETRRNTNANVPWNSAHESGAERSFDDFLSKSGLDGSDATPSTPAPLQKFLQQSDGDAEESKAVSSSISSNTDAQQNTLWSAQETNILDRAMSAAHAFMQAKHGGDDYYPSYSAQSGEILGLLKQLKEEMQGDLSDAQKQEMEKAAQAAELLRTKVAEVESMEKQAEAKEDQKAQADIDLANAKEELVKTEATLSETQKFYLDMKKSCSEAGTTFEERKKARLSEIQAVSDAIAILTSDAARDTFKEGYSFLQLSTWQKGTRDARKLRAVALLKRTAAKVRSPEMSVLASRVELDSFSRVKKAIDDMVAMLNVQQKDEVKKNDWCKSKLHENEMATMHTGEKKATLTQKSEDLDSEMAKLADDIAKATASISDMQMNLQRQTENRQKENMDFQKTIADQRAVQSVLKQALERLAKFYKEESLIQSKKGQQGQPWQKSYSKSTASTGVLSLLEKLIYDARDVEAAARKSEQEAQDQYNELVADTNASIKELQKLVTAKTEDKATASELKTETDGDLKDTENDLQELAKVESGLHADCDYLVKNFDARQEARQQEVEALAQAKAILSGAAITS